MLHYSSEKSGLKTSASYWLTIFVIVVANQNLLVFARDSRGGIQNEAVAPMKVYVDNKNDFSPVISNCPRHLEVLEEQRQPLFEIFRAKDEDKSVNGVIQFSLKSAEDEGEEKFKFSHLSLNLFLIDELHLDSTELLDRFSTKLNPVFSGLLFATVWSLICYGFLNVKSKAYIG